MRPEARANFTLAYIARTVTSQCHTGIWQPSVRRTRARKSFVPNETAVLSHGHVMQSARDRAGCRAVQFDDSSLTPPAGNGETNAVLIRRGGRYQGARLRESVRRDEPASARAAAGFGPFERAARGERRTRTRRGRSYAVVPTLLSIACARSRCDCTVGSAPAINALSRGFWAAASSCLRRSSTMR